MASSTRTQIADLASKTAANSINPGYLAGILEDIEDELDGNDSSYTSTDIHTRTKTLETTASNLSSRMTAAEGDVSTLQTTVTTQGNSITTLQSTTTSQGSSITTLQSSYSSHNSRIATLETKTSMGGSVYGGVNAIAPLTNAIPLYIDSIKTESDYPLKVVRINTASSCTIDFSQISLAKSEFLIDCRDAIDLTAKMTQANITMHQSMMLNVGCHYRLTILTVLDTTQHQSYNPSDVEYHAFLEQM